MNVRFLLKGTIKKLERFPLLMESVYIGTGSLSFIEFIAKLGERYSIISVFSIVTLA